MNVPVETAYQTRRMDELQAEGWTSQDAAEGAQCGEQRRQQATAGFSEAVESKGAGVKSARCEEEHLE